MNISVPPSDISILNLGNTSLIPGRTTKVQNSESDPRSNNMSVSTVKTVISQGTNGSSGGYNSSNGSSSTSNKNLSHVPCKFYKQGICQAGNTCPFSHNLDGTLAADKLPCKYFQKGNCKFGLKCALAHFLPDGTRVNSRSLSMGSNYNNNRRHSNNNFSNTSNSNMFLGNATSPSTSQPITIDSTPFTSRPGVSVSQSSNNIANFVYLRTKSFGASYYDSGNSNDNILNGHLPTSNSYSGALGNTSNPISLSNPSNPHVLRTYPNSSSPNFFSGASPQNNLPSPQVNFLQSPPDSNDSSRFLFSSKLDVSPSYSYIQESAIVDEDEGDEYDNEINVFEEDYLPASLGDFILTPQELQRRDSRSQSGTLLVRPNINSILNATKEAEEKKKNTDKTSRNNDTEISFTSDLRLDSAQEDVFLME